MRNNRVAAAARASPAADAGATPSRRHPWGRAAQGLWIREKGISDKQDNERRLHEGRRRRPAPRGSAFLAPRARPVPTDCARGAESAACSEAREGPSRLDYKTNRSGPTALFLVVSADSSTSRLPLPG